MEWDWWTFSIGVCVGCFVLASLQACWAMLVVWNALKRRETFGDA